MANNQENNHQDIGGGLDLQGQFGKTEQFVTENKKSLLIILGAVVVMGGLFIGWNLYHKSQDKEAQDQMFRAEQYFEVDSLDKALNGDGNYPGFAKIIDEYSGTKAANLAYYYAGICYLKKGEYQKAIDHLESYSSKDEVTSATSLGAIGDAYSELKQYEKAADFYQKAADKKLQSFSPIYLMKLGMIYEELKKNDKAIEAYNTIKTEYSDSQQARTIDEYIARAEAKL
ncbi:YfgM family protein [Solitalea lacus]|uniref:YfgM family protein n=1 Tax=Solitalea lacus TaxID=2911172 RepID=UPI001EDA6A42|nr:tetratricopeptide repeat protein [Solitalea lacus]UKJ08353.1 tetratricopeptide repeat protein [Solitalea lacus]